MTQKMLVGVIGVEVRIPKVPGAKKSEGKAINVQ